MFYAYVKKRTHKYTHTDKQTGQTLNEQLNLPRRILKHPGKKRVIREGRWWRTKRTVKKKRERKRRIKKLKRRWFLSLFRNSNQLSFREHHTFEMKGGMEGRGDDGKEGQVKE